MEEDFYGGELSLSSYLLKKKTRNVENKERLS